MTRQLSCGTPISDAWQSSEETIHASSISTSPSESTTQSAMGFTTRPKTGGSTRAPRGVLIHLEATITSGASAFPKETFRPTFLGEVSQLPQDPGILQEPSMEETASGKGFNQERHFRRPGLAERRLVRRPLQQPRAKFFAAEAAPLTVRGMSASSSRGVQCSIRSQQEALRHFYTTRIA